MKGKIMCLEKVFPPSSVKISYHMGYVLGVKRFNTLYSIPDHLLLPIMDSENIVPKNKWVHEKSFRSEPNLEMLEYRDGEKYPTGFHAHLVDPRDIDIVTKLYYPALVYCVLLRDVVAVGVDNGCYAVVAKEMFVIPRNEEINLEELYSPENWKERVLQNRYRKPKSRPLFVSKVHKDFHEMIQNCNTDKPEEKMQMIRYMTRDMRHYTKIVAIADLYNRCSEIFKKATLIHMYGYYSDQKYLSFYKRLVEECVHGVPTGKYGKLSNELHRKYKDIMYGGTRFDLIEYDGLEKFLNRMSDIQMEQFTREHPESRYAQT
jgi:hypothetical protein